MANYQEVGNVFRLASKLANSDHLPHAEKKEPPNEPPMPPSDYVTHLEFSDAMQRIDDRFEHVATKADLAEVKAEIHKWMLGTMLSILVSVVGVLSFFMTFSRPPQAQTLSQQPPIIINIPSSGTTPPATNPAPQNKQRP